jgi:hypothetical protein
MKRSTLARKSPQELRKLRDLVVDVIAEKDSRPTERAIPGHLLREFELDTWEGWAWFDDPPYCVDPVEAAEWGFPLLDDDAIYDLRPYTLEDDKGQERPFWELFRPWLESRSPKPAVSQDAMLVIRDAVNLATFVLDCVVETSDDERHLDARERAESILERFTEDDPEVGEDSLKKDGRGG